MSANRNRPRRRAASTTMRRSQIVIAITLVLSLFVAWTMLAYSGAFDSVSTQKSKKSKTVSTASLNSNSPWKEYIFAGGRLVATEEPTSSTLSAPSNLRTTTSTSNAAKIQITWNAVPGAARYELQRSGNYGDPNHNGFINVSSSVTTSTFCDGNISGVIAYCDTVTVGTAYIYRVRAYDAASGGNASPFSNIDLATATAFSEDPVQRGMTIKDFHILRLRDAINYVRIAAGVGTFAVWTDPSTLAQVVIKKEHVQELRDKLRDASDRLGLSPPSYTDPTIIRYSTPVLAAHVQELRRLVKGYMTAIDNP